MKLSWGHLFLAWWVVAATTAVSTAPQARSQRPRPISGSAAVSRVQAAATPPPASLPPPSQVFVDTYCATCHNQRLNTAGLAFDKLDVANVAAHAQEWEKVVVKLRAGLMPPSGVRRPEQSIIDGFATSVEAALDRAAQADPNPGRTEPFHRLNRAEYQNAIRDLLALDIDGGTLLPTDEVSYGFDNIAGVLKLSPLLTERYLNAAQKVARLALGTPAPPNGELYRVPDQLDQDVRLEGMPVGTRGGTRIDYLAPRDGEYDIKARIGRGIDYDIPHFIGEQNLEISVDGERVHMFTLPATPDESLNIERQVFKAPGTGGGRVRERKVDANGDVIPDEAALAQKKARRQLGDSRAAQGRGPRDSGDVSDEDRRRLGGLPQALSEALHRPGPHRRQGDTRRGGACGSSRSWGPSIPAARRRPQAIVASLCVIPPRVMAARQARRRAPKKRPARRRFCRSWRVEPIAARSRTRT